MVKGTLRAELRLISDEIVCDSRKKEGHCMATSIGFQARDDSFPAQEVALNAAGFSAQPFIGPLMAECPRGGILIEVSGRSVAHDSAMLGHRVRMNFATGSLRRSGHCTAVARLSDDR